MNQKKNTLLFSILFLFVFVYVGKNSNLKGTKKYLISLQIAWILIFGPLNSANAKDNSIIPGVHGFQPPISRQNTNVNNQFNQIFNGAKPNIPSPNKPPRAPSGFQSGFPISHKPIEKQGFYGGATGLGASSNGSGNGSSGGSSSPADDSNQNNIRSKSLDNYSNPNSSNQGQKKKKKENSRQISEESVIIAYKEFLSKMQKKGYKIDISQDRFLELCKNPQTGKFDDKSIFETLGGLELEVKGIVNNLRRPDNPKVDLDFIAERVESGKTIFIDHKGMIDFASLSDKGINISRFPSHESVAFNMGKDSVDQKGKFIGIEQGPTSMEEVVHLYNFENIRNKTEIPLLVQAVLNGAEQAGYIDGIIFLNY